MTKINDPADLNNGDLFGYKIKYNQVEGQETPNNDFINLQVKPKFNGNIAEIDWRTATTSGDNLRRYGYVYDSLNRLKAGFYQKDTNPTAKEYFEKMDYDLNGNITNLKRSEGILPASSTAMTIDNLNYVYTGNKLNSVTDISGQYNGYPDTSGNTINYDSNGNMKNHVDKGIENLDYNYLNLPNYILFNFGLPTRGGIIRNNLSYLYRADGVKLKKIYNYAPANPDGTVMELSTEITDYIDGFQYKGNGKTGKGGFTSLLFYPTTEGYYDFVKNKYIYNYADHLGNTRLSYFHNGSSIEVLEENNYYPFGLKHEGYNPTAGNPSYQYKYNGKELQETGMYDYGARFYMPDIGRWGVVDPLAEKYRRWSPYNYVMNNPLRFIDPDGRSVETVKPTNEASLKAIQNTLPKEDRQFVTLDKDGNIDREVLNSHKSTSGNYSNLLELVNSTTTIEYSVANSVSYYDKNGNYGKDDASEIRYGTPDKGMHLRTGESADLMGTTLVPSNDKRTSEKVKTSTNNNVQVYTNGNLSEEGQAQNASHELIGGHALFYVRGETWVHQVNGSRWEGDTIIRIEGNTKLKESITKSIDETVNNMK